MLFIHSLNTLRTLSRTDSLDRNMPTKSYTGSYTGSSTSKRSRRSLGGGEIARTRPRLLDRPWVSRLMVASLLALLTFGIIGFVVSCIVLSGLAGLPELCLAQAFLFFAVSCLSPGQENHG